MEALQRATQRWTLKGQLQDTEMGGALKGQCHETEKGLSVMSDQNLCFFRQPLPDGGPATSTLELDFKGTVSGYRDGL